MNTGPKVYPTDFFQLCYRGSDEKIQLGDFITYRHFVGLRRMVGRVYYIPGVSPPHSEMSYGPNAAFWAIKLPGEVLVSWLYVPKEGATLASRRLRLVSRSDGPYIGLESGEKVGIGLPYEEEPNKAPD